MSRRATLLALAAAGALAWAGCGSEWARRLAPPSAPHEAYAAALRDAGLAGTVLGRTWNAAAARALRLARPVALPADHTVEAAAAAPDAWAARLPVRQGERLQIEVAAALADSARAFVDLFRAPPPGDTAGVGPRLAGDAVFGDTLRLERTVERDDTLLLRVQPELLATGRITVRVETAPSLAFPVAGAGEGAIQSRWGDPRDAGARRHEGVDVFAPRGRPAVAAAAGRVTRVRETPVGGRVVWLRPDDLPVSLYYAHLDEQRVREGERVGAGDTLGLVGTTGNARGGAPHLHFGVYARGGAVDPYPYLVGRRPGERTEAAAPPAR